MAYNATLLMSEFVTHDVKRFIVTKPDMFTYTPGQGTELVINLPGWRDQEGRPFTPTALLEDKVLEFTIKRYPDHHGVTAHLHTLPPGTGLLLTKPFGTITYQGPGLFIAAGAGLTPFLSIIRNIAASGTAEENALLFSNKTRDDIICEKELRHTFGDRAVFTLTRENNPAYRHGRIDKALIERSLDAKRPYAYVCGPDEFVKQIRQILGEQGLAAEYLVFEK
jgi:cytochrome-b5 reductase